MTFDYPAEKLLLSEEDRILSVAGAQWFLPLLRRVHDLEIDEDLLQEDWGVVIYVRRRQFKFWMGLSDGLERDQAWLAHFHMRSFAWLARFRSMARDQFQNLLFDVHQVLTRDRGVTNIVWHEQTEFETGQSRGHPGPLPEL